MPQNADYSEFVAETGKRSAQHKFLIRPGSIRLIHLHDDILAWANISNKPSVYTKTEVDAFLAAIYTKTEVDALLAAIDHDALVNFEADEHINWTNASSNFKTTGTTTLYGDVYTDRWIESDTNVFFGVGVCGADNLAHSSGDQGYYNVGIGKEALNSITTGFRHVAIGYRALYTVTTSFDCCAIGFEALKLNTSGSDNFALGWRTLYLNQTGSVNVAIGNSALYYNVSGSYNVAIGNSALNLSTANYNVGIGFQSARRVTGAGNVSIGVNSLYKSTTSFYNVALGTNVLYENVTGDNNTVVGYQGGLGVSAQSVNNNVVLGFKAGYNLSGDGNVFLGYQAGYNETGSDKLYIDNSNTTTPLILGDFSADKLWFYGRVFQNAPSSAPTDGDLANGQITFHLDEGGDKVKIRAKYSDGTLKSWEGALT